MHHKKLVFISVQQKFELRECKSYKKKIWKSGSCGENWVDFDRVNGNCNFPKITFMIKTNLPQLKYT